MPGSIKSKPQNARDNMQILKDALAIYNERATFEQAGIAPGA